MSVNPLLPIAGANMSAFLPTAATATPSALSPSTAGLFTLTASAPFSNLVAVAAATAAAAGNNGRRDGWLRLEVCREFLRKKCSRTSEDCKYAHPPSHVDQEDGFVVCCYDSLKGNCKRTQPPCKFLHPPEHLKAQLLERGKQNLQVKNTAAAVAAAAATNPGAAAAGRHLNFLPTAPFSLYSAQTQQTPQIIPLQSLSYLQAGANPPSTGANLLCPAAVAAFNRQFLLNQQQANLYSALSQQQQQLVAALSSMNSNNTLASTSTHSTTDTSLQGGTISMPENGDNSECESLTKQSISTGTSSQQQQSMQSNVNSTSPICNSTVQSQLVMNRKRSAAQANMEPLLAPYGTPSTTTGPLASLTPGFLFPSQHPATPQQVLESLYVNAAAASASSASQLAPQPPLQGDASPAVANFYYPSSSQTSASALLMGHNNSSAAAAAAFLSGMTLPNMTSATPGGYVPPNKRSAISTVPMSSPSCNGVPGAPSTPVSGTTSASFQNHVSQFAMSQSGNPTGSLYMMTAAQQQSHQQQQLSAATLAMYNAYGAGHPQLPY